MFKCSNKYKFPYLLFSLPKMVSIPSSDSVVLVTGVNGFLGSHIADQFLSSGFRVRGTVRSIPKAENIRKALVEKHGQGRFEVISVPDITIDGAFDEAVKGIKAPHR
jgi:nucleoside-diphosphate-sugar epimerase